jgi:uncharacterized protein involved in exopolysaccharide biosynthesis
LQFAIPLLLLLSLSAAEPPKPDVTALLQKGLFEEEVNRNFEAAIAEYRQAVAQFDKQRAYAATAIFRLAECNRKLGKTNDAQALYQRIPQEFRDQTNLAALALNHVPRPAPATAIKSSELARTLQKLQSLQVDTVFELAQLKDLLVRLKAMPRDQLAKSLTVVQPDGQLQALQQERDRVLQKQAQLGALTADGNETTAAERMLDAIEKQINERMEGILLGMTTRLLSYQAREEEFTKLSEKLSRELEQAKSGNQNTELGGGTVTPQENSLAGELLKQSEAHRIQSQAEVVQTEKLLQSLKQLPRDQLIKALSSASPDPVLNELVAQRATCLQRISKLGEDKTDQHPEMVAEKRVLATIDRQVDERIEGILIGLKIKLDALKARWDKANEETDTLRQAILREEAKRR